MHKSNITRLPTSSGIYLFKDTYQRIIYIGKAKSLRKRVSSYFKTTTDFKIDTLMHEVADVSFITTVNEIEAMLLEAQLIKQYQPKFNILLKDGQPFVYLLFTHDELPRLELVRNKNKKGTYFGPFLHKTNARKVYDYLQKTFRLKQCNKKIANGCLDFHLGFCSGTCTGTTDKAEYQFRIVLAMRALQNNHQAFLRDLKDRITAHNNVLAFEKSRSLTDYLNNFQTIFATLHTHFTEQKYAKEAAIAVTPTPLELQPVGTNLAQELASFLDLEKPVHTIDCFDISHFQSKAMVGSCIRFTNGVAEKNKFRRFKIKTLNHQNDCAALQEIVKRRYYKDGDYPDLILIDGGKGQLNAIKPLVSVPCVSLAKREELLFSTRHPEGTPLHLHTEIGKLCIALRDYAHHFAITYHRLVRSKERSHK